MRTAIISVTGRGQKLGKRIAEKLLNSECIERKAPVSQILGRLWGEYDRFVFIMAVGAVVRLIAPFVRDKYSDPCVVAVDELGLFSVSLLSGHIGGGNDLAQEVATMTGGQAVITTASDILGHTAIDLWVKRNNLVPENRCLLTRVSVRLIDSGKLRIYSDIPMKSIPHDFEDTHDYTLADIIVSVFAHKWPDYSLVLRPKVLVVGVGCNRGVNACQIGQAFKDAFDEHGLSEESVSSLATIDLKRDEAGLLEFASGKGLKIDFFTAEQLNSVKGVSRSDASIKATGAIGVSEPAALLGAYSEKLIIRKMKWKDVTLAVAMAPSI